MEHKEGAHPEMAMALENIKVIHTPASKGIRYDYDGLAKVYNDRNKNNVGESCYEDNGQKPSLYELQTAPHSLIWGKTGSGKSIYINQEIEE